MRRVLGPHPPAAVGITFRTTPGSAVSGSPMSPQPVVALVDQYGNTDKHLTGYVTASAASPATLAGTTQQPMVLGVVTFTDLAVTASTKTTLTFVLGGVQLLQSRLTFDYTPTPTVTGCWASGAWASHAWATGAWVGM